MEIRVGESRVFPSCASHSLSRARARIPRAPPKRRGPFKSNPPPSCESVVVVKILEKLPRETPRLALSPDALACLVTARNISLSILIPTRAPRLPLSELRSVLSAI